MGKNYKKGLLFLAMLAATQTMNAQKFWASLWSVNPAVQSGIYEFNADSNDNNFEPIALSDSLVANEGYLWKGNAFYEVNYRTVDGQALVNYFAYDTRNFHVNYTEAVQNSAVLSLASAWDATEGVGYGCFATADGYGVEWAKFNYATFEADEKVSIKELDKNILAVAIDAEGQAYGVDEDGNFLKIDKATGEQTVVGATGVESKTQQSADFDPATGKLYWTVEPTGGKSGLYEIDVTTGKATLVKEFPNNECFLALHVLATPAPGAPAKVNDLTFTPDYDHGGTLSFTLPEKTVDGQPLEGELKYTIVNGWTTKNFTGQPGEKVEWSFGYINYMWGDQTFIVQSENEVGKSEEARKHVWVYTEKPAVVEPEEPAEEWAYEYDFNEAYGTLDWSDNYAEETAAPEGWQHLVDNGDGYFQAPTYVFKKDGGVDGTGCLKVGYQSDYDEDDYEVIFNDLLVSPKVSGKISLMVKKYFSTGSVKFFEVTQDEDGLHMGRELSATPAAALNSNEFVEVTLDVAQPTLIGIRVENSFIDNFKAEKLENGEATGINNAAVNGKLQNVHYNAAGQRINANTKGLHIVNGRKFIVK